MRDLEELLKFAEEKTERGSIVLCTLVRKHGSSYRAVGAKKFVALDEAANSGTLSGGCMEGAIERSAREGFARMPFIESFSTMSDEDRLMGYQTGCQGRIEVLFELVPQGARRSELSLLLAYGSPRAARAVRISLAHEDLGTRTLVDELGVGTRHSTNGSEILDKSETAFLDRWIEPLALTVIGCGADSDAYIGIAHALGWKARFIDYRSDLVERFQSLCKKSGTGFEAARVPAAEIPRHVSFGERSAVILATHNYEADLEILLGLAKLELGYIGCLGPMARWERLKRDLAQFHDVEVSTEWEARLFAPAGIFSRGRSPTEIALSIVAQVQGVLNEPVPEHEWTIILAAGKARRFGGPKALALWQEPLKASERDLATAPKTLLAHAVAKARTVTGKRVLVITGAHRAEIEVELRKISDATGFAVASAHNESWETGLGSSLGSGISALLTHDAHARLALIVPIDQPLITAAHLRELAREARVTDRCALTSDELRSGPPAALPRRLFELAIGLDGDLGLKSVLRPADFLCVHAPDELRDADRPAELAELALRANPA
jgi:xanthine dehydrogenase accessory factor